MPRQQQPGWLQAAITFAVSLVTIISVLVLVTEHEDHLREAFSAQVDRQIQQTAKVMCPLLELQATTPPQTLAQAQQIQAARTAFTGLGCGTLPRS